MKPTQKLTFSINPLFIIIGLVIVIIAMLALWRPWEGSRTERTVTVTGQGEIKGVPDEFTFSPTFQRIGTDTAKQKAELDAFGTKLLADVTKLGVNKDDVTINSSSYDQPTAAIEPSYPGGKPTSSGQNTVVLSVTIKTPTKELAQKVQDYLATTDAEGQITSQPNFSKTKRQQLEDQARDKATKDAREKADRTAKNLGGSVGKVITIKDSAGSSVYPLYSGAAEDVASSRSSLPVTPGRETVGLSVQVVFELR